MEMKALVARRTKRRDAEFKGSLGCLADDFEDGS